MRREDVVQACRNGQLRVYTVDGVRSALELLTGIRAGQPYEGGGYPENTLLGLNVARAIEYWVKASQNAPQFPEPPNISSQPVR